MAHLANDFQRSERFRCATPAKCHRYRFPKCRPPFKYFFFQLLGVDCSCHLNFCVRLQQRKQLFQLFLMANRCLKCLNYTSEKIIRSTVQIISFRDVIFFLSENKKKKKIWVGRSKNFLQLLFGIKIFFYFAAGPVKNLLQSLFPDSCTFNACKSILNF